MTAMVNVVMVLILDAEGQPAAGLLDLAALDRPNASAAERQLFKRVRTALASGTNRGTLTAETQQETLESPAWLRQHPSEVCVLDEVTLYVEDGGEDGGEGGEEGEGEGDATPHPFDDIDPVSTEGIAEIVQIETRAGDCHGDANGDPDYAIGDWQEALTTALGLMTPRQRAAYLEARRESIEENWRPE